MSEDAKVQFESLMREKVHFLCTNCYAGNVPGVLRDINEIIEAGRSLGVTDATPLSKDEVEDLVQTLRPLRTLQMNNRTKSIIASHLQKHGYEYIP